MKKKLKRISLFILLGLITFIVYSNYRVRGTWIGVNLQQDSSGSSSSGVLRNATVLNFSYFTMDSYDAYISNSVASKPYFVFNKSIFSEPKNEFDLVRNQFTHIYKDSIMLRDCCSTYTFRKIPDSLKEKEHLNVANTYFKLNQDTVHFSEDNLIQRNKSDQKPKWIDSNYKLFRMNGFQLFADGFGNLAILKKQQEDINIYLMSKDSIFTLTLTEVQPTKKFITDVAEGRKRLKYLDSLYSSAPFYKE